MSNKEAVDSTDDQITEADTKQETIPGRSDITVKPRPGNQNDKDLTSIRDNAAAVDVIVQVDDDSGEFLQAPDLEKEVVACCEKYRAIIVNDKSPMDNPVAVIEEANGILKRYVTQVNIVGSLTEGFLTKYRIQLGGIYLILQAAVTRSKHTWKTWFAREYDPRQFRTIQDFTRLAKINGIAKYAFFGKERLLNLARLINEKDLNDPVGKFLDAYGINYKPREDIHPVELKFDTDVVINTANLDAAGITGYSADKVIEVTRKGIVLAGNRLKELARHQESDGDINKLLSLYIKGKKAEPVLTSEEKAKEYKSVTDRFLTNTEQALQDSAFLGKVNMEDIVQLKTVVAQLEKMLKAKK